jgi:hypothetical protein
MKANMLVADENRKLYYVVRLPDGKVFNTKTNKAEAYNKENLRDYAQIPAYAGGDVWMIPETFDIVVIVYEMMKFNIDKKSGEKTYEPTESDKIVEVFGDAKLSK